MSRASGKSVPSDGSAYRVTTLPPDVDAEAVADAVRRASGIRHDAVVPVVDLARDGERWCVVEAPGAGEPLDHILRDRGALAPLEALHVARQLADGLAAAHAGGIVHGAITPAEVWLRRGERPRAALAGFATGTLSAPRAAYAPPERLRGDAADARGDVFALGLLLFEMLEGRAFLAGDADTIRATLLDGTGPLLPRFSHIPPAGVSALVARAIRRSPAQRQQTMAQVKSEIDACLVRLGEITIAPKRARPRAPEITVRRRIVVVDDTLDEPAEMPAALALPRPRAPRPRVPRVALGVVAAGIGLALGFAVLRRAPVPTPPAAPPRPAPAVAPAPEPAPPPPPEEPAVAEPLADVAPPIDEPAPAVAPPIDEPAPAAAPPAPAPNVAPRIVSRRPRADRVEVTEGAGVDFDVRATDDPGDRLRYTWLLDGRPVARGPRWRFVVPSAASATEHAVEARVADAAGLAAAPVAWTVTVAPRMTEIDVRGWLDRLVAAWERHDVATLRLYGVDDADDVRPGQRVAIVNERIRTDGPYATVAFDRAVRDADGKIVSTDRASYELAKQPSGFVAVR